MCCAPMQNAPVEGQEAVNRARCCGGQSRRRGASCRAGVKTPPRTSGPSALHRVASALWAFDRALPLHSLGLLHVDLVSSDSGTGDTAPGQTLGDASSYRVVHSEPVDRAAFHKSSAQKARQHCREQRTGPKWGTSSVVPTTYVSHSCLRPSLGRYPDGLHPLVSSPCTLNTDNPRA